MVVVAGLVPLDQIPVARGRPLGLRVDAGFRIEEVMLDQVEFGAGLESQGNAAKEPALEPSPT
jgi:hypothetical protein